MKYHVMIKAFSKLHCQFKVCKNRECKFNNPLGFVSDNKISLSLSTNQK